MYEILLLNLIAIGAAYLILGLPTKRRLGQLDAAGVRLADTTVDKAVQARFLSVRKSSASKAQIVFWLVLVAIIALLAIGFEMYATSAAPGAALGTWLVMQFVIFGIALVGVAVLLSRLVSAYWQSRQVTALVTAYAKSYPNSPVLREVSDAIAPRVGELGVSAIAALTVVGCTLYGLALVAIFYMAAQTAIDCARTSSKCI